MVHVFADGVGSALIPVSACIGLLRRKNIYKSAAERVEFIGLLNVPVQRSRVKLCKQINALATRIYAVAYGNIHKPVLARKRNSGLAARLCKRIKARASSAAHNDAYNVFHTGFQSRTLFQEIK